MNFASRTTRLTPSENEETLQLEGGKPIRVHCILISNEGIDTFSTVDIKSGDGGILYASVMPGFETTFIEQISWIAYQGLSFTFDSPILDRPEDLSVTVFYQSPGT